MEGAEEKKKQVPIVPETLKIKGKDFREIKIKCFRKKFAQKMLRKARRKLIHEKANHFTRNTGICELHLNFYVPMEPKLVFVIRIRGVNELSTKFPKVLQLLSFCQIFSGTFVKSTRFQLTSCAYGNPNLKSVNELIYSMVMAKSTRSKLP
ncbi:hypothetical protein K5549_000083 [Capra hircus]|nr:hypothetical protein K5549_000083 [Capra hircus]